MQANRFRGFLLAAVSALMLSSGVALADPDKDGSGHGGGNGSQGGGNGNEGGGNGNQGGGNGNSGNNNNGSGNSGNNNSGSGNSGNNNSGSGNSGNNNSDSGNSGNDNGGGGNSSSGGGSSGGGSTSGGGSSGGGSGGTGGSGGAGGSSSPPADRNNAPPSTAEPAFGSAAPSRTVSAPDREPTFSAEDLVASLPPLRNWTLADFSGTRVIDTSGAGIGTVEAVMVDPANNLYLLTALDSHDQDGHERVIPISQFHVDAPSQSLVLGDEAVQKLPLMADLAAVASAFMMVDNDPKLRSLMALH